MKKLLLILLGFYIGLVVFMPKKELFYKVERMLPVNIEANITQTPISLMIKNAKIYYANINSANLNATIYPLILYNQANVNLFINSLNTSFNNIKIIYSPFLPFKVFIKGENLNGFVNLKEKHIHITFSKPPNSIKDFLQKTNKGYVFDENF